MYRNEHCLANNQGGVFLERVAYLKVLDALETLKSIGANHANQEVEAQQTLTELLDRVATEKERMTLTYKKKVFLTIVPIEDIDVIQQLENCIDNADADDALKKDGVSLDSAQVDKILGW